MNMEKKLQNMVFFGKIDPACKEKNWILSSKMFKPRYLWPKCSEKP